MVVDLKDLGNLNLKQHLSSPYWNSMESRVSINNETSGTFQSFHWEWYTFLFYDSGIFSMLAFHLLLVPLLYVLFFSPYYLLFHMTSVYQMVIASRYYLPILWFVSLLNYMLERSSEINSSRIKTMFILDWTLMLDHTLPLSNTWLCLFIMTTVCM